MDRRSRLVVAAAAAVILGGGSLLLRAQTPYAMPERPLQAGAFTVDSAEQGPISVTVTKGLSHPWSLAFLPDGSMLITERPGRLRLIRDHVLDPQPIAGVPVVHAEGLGGLMDVALHPRFAETRLVYLSFTKPMGQRRHTSALVRGRLDGRRLVDVREIFVGNTVDAGPIAANALAFGSDGHLYMSVGGAADDVAQQPASHLGKVVRLRDDGGVPDDNPFAQRAGYAPEIYSLGHRNILGLAVHPMTGALWASENGPLGGDEINVLKAGGNYGWPRVTFGRHYSGARVSDHTGLPGFEDPVVVWIPSIAVAGLTFYTGDRFPAWKNNLFVAALQFGRIRGTGQLQRIAFNEWWEEVRREAFFVELRQRIRAVREGPDGLLYLLTDEEDGALLQLEPGRKAVAVRLDSREIRM